MRQGRIEYIRPETASAARSRCEREAGGRDAHRTFLAVTKSRKMAGQAVPEADQRPWEDLSDSEQEMFRRAAESLKLPDEVMFALLANERKKMGEEAFRRKMFEMSIDILIEGMRPDFSAAEHYRAVDQIMKLSEMLKVPPADKPEGAGTATHAANRPAL